MKDFFKTNFFKYIGLPSCYSEVSVFYRCDFCSFCFLTNFDYLLKPIIVFPLYLRGLVYGKAFLI